MMKMSEKEETSENGDFFKCPKCRKTKFDKINIHKFKCENCGKIMYINLFFREEEEEEVIKKNE